MTNLLAKTQGKIPTLPRSVLDNLKRVRALHHKYVRGDFTHHRNDSSATIELAHWLTRTYAECRKQDPKFADIEEHRLRRSEFIGDVNVYRQMCTKVAQGWE